MTNTEARHRAERCPECGAPLDLDNLGSHQQHAKCAYCGSTIRLAGRAVRGKKATKPTATVSGRISRDGTLVKGGGISRWFVGLMLLFLAIPVFFLFGVGSLPNGQIGELVQVGSAPQELESRPFLYATLLPVREDTDSDPPQVVSLFQREDESYVLLYDPAIDNAVWQSDAFAVPPYELALAASDEFVFVVGETTLTALALEDGSLLWQMPLANRLQTGCKPSGCLRVIGRRVILLLRDGTLQAIEAKTGTTDWSRRMLSTPRQLQVANGELLVIDTDTRKRALILVLDSATGETRLQIAPVCTRGHEELSPRPNEQFLVSPDQRWLAVVGSGGVACVWRYDLATGELTWQVAPEDARHLPFAWSQANAMIRGDSIYVALERNGEHAVVEYDTSKQPQDGSSVRQVMNSDDYALELLDLRENLLLAIATPDYDQGRREVWGVAADSGSKIWGHSADIEHPFDSLVARFGPEGLFMSQCLWETKICLFEVLNLRTGASRDREEVRVEGRLAAVAWTTQYAYLLVWGDLFVVDLETQLVVATWQ